MIDSKTSYWQEFCFDLVNARNDDVLEGPYQELIETGLRQLGWSKAKGEICPKERINIGSKNQLEPDITLKIRNNSVFVIEVKRPNNKITERQEEQLLSYMRQTTNKFGLYIGSDIRLFYDTGNRLPMLVWKTDIALDANEGKEFIDFFFRETFNENRIKNYCENKYNEQKTTDIMAAFTNSLATNQDSAIRQALMEYFVDYKKCDKNLVRSILESFNFSTSPKERQQSIDENISSIKSNGIIIASGKKNNGKKDMTKFSLDGGVTKFGKGRFVREVVSSFIKQNPTLTMCQIAQIFPDEMQGSYGVVRTIEELNASKHDKKDLFTRYEANPPLISGDGIPFAVCNQWGTYNFNNILNLLTKWGWDIIKS